MLGAQPSWSKLCHDWLAKERMRLPFELFEFLEWSDPPKKGPIPNIIGLFFFGGIASTIGWAVNIVIVVEIYNGPLTSLIWDYHQWSLFIQGSMNFMLTYKMYVIVAKGWQFLTWSGTQSDNFLGLDWHFTFGLIRVSIPYNKWIGFGFEQILVVWPANLT